MIWSRDVMLQTLYNAQVPEAGKIVDIAFPVTRGDEDFRGIVISTTLGAPVGVYGIYENLRFSNWPDGHDPIVADAKQLWRHRIIENGSIRGMNMGVIGVRPPVSMPAPLGELPDRWGPAPRGTVDDLLREAARWRAEPHRWTQDLRDMQWNNLVSYLQDNLYQGD